MSTLIRPEISKTNDFYIPKHRYYELKHFCLQYSDWKKKSSYFDGMGKSKINQPVIKNFIKSDVVFDAVQAREYYQSKINIVNKSCELLCNGFERYIFEGVTSGVGYNYLRTILSIPCGKDTYYKDYHKFFWILDKMQIFEKIGEKTTPIFAF